MGVERVPRRGPEPESGAWPLDHGCQLRDRAVRIPCGATEQIRTVVTPLCDHQLMDIAAVDAAAWQAWGTWATVAVSVVVGVFIWQQVRGLKQQVKEAKDLREAEMRPYVVVDFEVFERRPIILLTVANVGRTLARNVRLAFDPPLSSAIDQPDLRMDPVYMRMDGIEGTGGPVPRASYDGLWKAKGWEEVPPPVSEDPLAGVRLLSEGMPTLAPGRTIPIVFDSIFSRDGRGYPDAYTVTVSYVGEGDRQYEDTILLDLGVYRNIRCVENRNLNDIYGQVKRIADALQSGTNERRLRDLVP